MRDRMAPKIVVCLLFLWQAFDGAERSATAGELGRARLEWLRLETESNFTHEDAHLKCVKSPKAAHTEYCNRVSRVYSNYLVTYPDPPWADEARELVNEVTRRATAIKSESESLVANTSDGEGIDPVELFLGSKITRKNIENMQEALRMQGHDPGPVDGLLGDKTRAAIAAWFEDRSANGEMSNKLSRDVRHWTRSKRKSPGEVVIKSSYGHERERIPCAAGEYVFLAGLPVPCGATLIAEEGQVGGRIEH